MFSSICFALVMSAFVQIGGDSGGIYLDKIFIVMLLGLLAYLIPAVLAFFFRKRLSFIKSWAWLGIGGAFFKVLSLAYSLTSWRYYQRISTTPDEAFNEFLLGGTSRLIAPWIFWVVLGCAFIFAVRFIAYFLYGKDQLQSNHTPVEG